MLFQKSLLFFFIYCCFHMVKVSAYSNFIQVNGSSISSNNTIYSSGTQTSLLLERINPNTTSMSGQWKSSPTVNLDVRSSSSINLPHSAKTSPSYSKKNTQLQSKTIDRSTNFKGVKSSVMMEPGTERQASSSIFTKLSQDIPFSAVRSNAKKNATIKSNLSRGSPAMKSSMTRPSSSLIQDNRNFIKLTNTPTRTPLVSSAFVNSSNGKVIILASSLPSKLSLVTTVQTLSLPTIPASLKSQSHISIDNSVLKKTISASVQSMIQTEKRLPPFASYPFQGTFNLSKSAPQSPLSPLSRSISQRSSLSQSSIQLTFPSSSQSPILSLSQSPSSLPSQYIAPSPSPSKVPMFTLASTLPTNVKTPNVVISSRAKLTNYSISLEEKHLNTTEKESVNVTLQPSTILKDNHLTSSAPKPTAITILVMYCPTANITTRYKGEYTLTETKVGKTVEKPCFYGGLPKTNATFTCSRNGNWLDYDVTFCFTRNQAKEIIYEIAKMNVSKGNVEKFSEFVSLALDNHFDTMLMIPRDVEILIKAVKKIAKYGQNRNKVIGKAMTIMAHLVQMKASLLKEQVVLDMRTVLSQIPAAVEIKNKSFEFVSKYIDLAVIRIKQGKGTGYNSTNLIKNAIDTIYLPPSLLGHSTGTKNERVSIYVLRNKTIFTSPKATCKKIISNIITVTIMDGKKYENLSEPVVIQFQVPSVAKYIPICSFWDNQKDDWSTKGCQHDKRIDDPSNDKVICKCNHLTTFAVLGKELAGDKKNSDYVIDTILNMTIFTCFLVLLAFLGFTVITYVTFRKLRQSRHSKIIIWLCLSLIFTTLSFVGSMTFVKQPMSCFIASRFLHYFVLTSFCWMLVQAVNLYRAIVVITVRRAEGVYFKWMSLGAIIVPLAITIITGYFDDHKKEVHSICFLNGNLFYFGAIAPSSAILVLTLAIYGPIFKNIILFERMIKNSIEMQRDEDNRRAQSAIIVDVCIIITWLVAVLSFSLQITSLKFVFSACVLLLGFVILYLDVIHHEDALTRWKIALQHCCEKSYRVRNNSDSEEKVKLRSKDSFHFQDTLDRKKRAAAVLSEGWV